MQNGPGQGQLGRLLAFPANICSAVSPIVLNTLVRKLIEQLMKFGIVGVIAFVIDWGILNLLVGIFHMHNVLAATISFIISLIFNYLASMKFVFKHRENEVRAMETFSIS